MPFGPGTYPPGDPRNSPGPGTLGAEGGLGALAPWMQRFGQGLPGQSQGGLAGLGQGHGFDLQGLLARIGGAMPQGTMPQFNLGSMMRGAIPPGAMQTAAQPYMQRFMPQGPQAQGGAMPPWLSQFMNRT